MKASLARMPSPFWGLVIVLAVIALLLAPAGHAQNTMSEPDTTAENTASNVPADHSPEGALWRSLAIPGWGQFYNRDYLKIPVVYAGLGGIGAFGVFANDRYYLFRNVYRYAQQPEEFPQYEHLAEPFQEEIAAGRTERLRRERERYRRYRDLSVAGFVAFYAFSVLDAYVSAHLLHFDVGEDLSFRFHSDPRGSGATLTFQF